MKITNCSKIRSVKYAGIDLDVMGDYVTHYPAVISSTDASKPEEGGLIEDMRVLLNNIDITDLLSDDIFNAIEKLAIEEFV
ncbi:MAG TPA: hypothetical protein VJ869_05075 [Sphaerochaeta sp.]|nr:hypothetical protein [Sphaerochaeta sp.]